LGVIEAILKNCGDENKKDLLERETSSCGPILFSALRRGHLEAIEVILKNCGDENKQPLIEKTDERGKTALLKSAFRGNIEIFKLLHENGADITKRSLGQKRSSFGSIFFKNNIHKETPVGIILDSFLRSGSSADCEDKLQQLFSMITPDHLNVNNKKIAREIEVFRAKAPPNLKLIVEENMRRILTPGTSLGSRVIVPAIGDNGPQHLM
jgi:ankyrin repeat protein